MLSAISCSLFPLISRIHSRLISDWRRTISFRFFDTRFPRSPLRNLCSLVTPAVFSLVFAASYITYCKGLISLELAESRILPVAPADTRIMTPLISFRAVQQRTLLAARSFKMCLKCIPESIFLFNCSIYHKKLN